MVPSTAPCPPNKCKSGVFTTTLTRIPAENAIIVFR